MRALYTFVGVLFSGLLVLGTWTTVAEKPANTVTLPVEVMGADGTTVSITIDGSNLGSADSLYLKAHSIGYPSHYTNDRGYTVNKASVRFNSGSWTDVTSSNGVVCRQPEEEYGCIDGPMHTIRFEFAVNDIGGSLSDGQNTLEFRVNYPLSGDRNNDAPGDVSSGYRILGVEARDTQNNDLIDNTNFVWDDPSTSPRYQIPSGYDNSSDISAGENLWTSRNILVDYWNGPQIVASCSDCHAREGRDLEYFAFSNKSIVTRSQFHGLTENEGKQIAAYIRNNYRNGLKDRDTGQSYEPPGRPWHPPYQPGLTAAGTRSETESRLNGQKFGNISSQYWAAGAGNQWVLDHDSTMMEFWWGANGIESQNGFGYDDVAITDAINVRRLPIALQYPDWNEWLPEVHPLDMYGSEFTNFIDNRGNPGPWQRYQDESLTSFSFEAIRDCMAANNDDASQCGLDIQQGLKAIVNQTERFRGTFPSPEPDMKIGYTNATYNLKRWQAAKQWELIHKYDLMDEADHAIPSATVTPPLAWASKRRDVFNHAAHILGENLKGPTDGYHDPYFDTAWYDLQIILNDGRGYTTSLQPQDWKYHFGHIYGESSVYDTPQALRYMRSYVRLIQNAEVGAQMRPGDFPDAWYLRHTQLGWLLQQFPSGELNTYRGNLRERMFSDVIRAFYEGAVVGHDWDSFPRNGGQFQIEPESYDARFITGWKPSEETNYANTTFTIVDEMEAIGACDTAVDSLKNWGKSLWPNTTNPTWDGLYSSDPSDCPIEVQGGPAGGSGGGGGGSAPTYRTEKWGNLPSVVPYPGGRGSEPNFVQMGPASTDGSVPGNFVWSKFYGVAPPEGQADYNHAAVIDSLFVPKGTGIGWDSFGYLALMTDTSDTATGCRVQVSGEYENRIIRTWCSGRGVSSGTWAFEKSVTAAQFYRNDHIVNAVKLGPGSYTLLDSLDVSGVPQSELDTLRTIVGIQNQATTGSQSATMKIDSDLEWVLK